jgi:hypothetical protein
VLAKSLMCLRLAMARQDRPRRGPACVTGYRKFFTHIKVLSMKPRILFALFVLGLGLVAALAFGPAAFARLTNDNVATACACGGGCDCDDCPCTCQVCDGECADCAACCKGAASASSEDLADARPSCCNVVRQCCVEKQACCA